MWNKNNKPVEVLHPGLVNETRWARVKKILTKLKLFNSQIQYSLMIIFLSYDKNKNQLFISP